MKKHCRPHPKGKCCPDCPCGDLCSNDECNCLCHIIKKRKKEKRESASEYWILETENNPEPAEWRKIYNHA